MVLVEEEIGKDPIRLARLISDKRISIWYSTPSILSFLAQYGKLDRYEFPDLRLVLFAGEVFPIKHLRMLKNILPKPRYFNLYGPTETNVCTACEVFDIPDDRTAPMPIGTATCGDRVWAVRADGTEADVDCGGVCHPDNAAAQIEGGVVFGLGYALTEELRLEEGRVTTTNFGEFKIPNPQDIPPLKTAVMETVPSGPGPYNSLAIGEVANVPTAAAVANAVADACGVRIRNLPITSEKVYEGLKHSD